MSRIFELFGYPLEAWSDEAEENCKKAWCPFVDARCDGGGNRNQSELDLSKYKELKDYFGDLEKVQAGVCSLQLKPDTQPWIVCPRRLLTFKEQSAHVWHNSVKDEIAANMGLPTGQEQRVWSEVKIKVHANNEEEESKTFDYTFDYVIAGKQRIDIESLAEIIGVSAKKCLAIAHLNKYTVSEEGDQVFIDDFPGDPLVIVEVMTSSTSGGDKKKRTQVAMAFEDAILSRGKHKGPGINYRQVWARMVSQLIVKSQVGLAWGGKTIWVLQDVLADYISSSTALNLKQFTSDTSDEVNILAMGYSDKMASTSHKGLPIALSEAIFYSGPIQNKSDRPQTSSFVDIIKLGAPPEKEHLLKTLFLKAPIGTITRK